MLVRMIVLVSNNGCVVVLVCYMLIIYIIVYIGYLVFIIWVYELM